MKIVATVALLHLCFCFTAVVSGDDSTETALTAAPGDVAILPCYSIGNVTPIVTTWMKNGQEVISGGVSTHVGEQQRLTVLHDGSLNIRGVTPGDEGSYLCRSTLPGNNTFRARVLLQVGSGPENISTSISPATTLPNRTLTVHQGSSVSFSCSASSYPSQQLTWSFRGATSSNESLVSSSGSFLDFRIDDIQPSNQGVYTCTAYNNFTKQVVNQSSELLVYYVPDLHPDCMWSPAQDPSHVLFICSWAKAYPSPLLHLEDLQGTKGAAWGAHVNKSAVTSSLSMMLNRSELFEDQTLRCTARHPALAPGEERECSLPLKCPFPDGEPLVTALEGSSVTLICTESTSNPSANTTWRKGLQQGDIIPGSKYVISEEGPVLKLTINNVTKDDEGVYFCRSENPLTIRELEVYLTVRASSAYTGAIVGLFIAVLIVGSAAIIAKTIYSSRHRICLGNLDLQVDDDRGDVLSLVDSDDEQIFQDAVPRLPPVTNGHQTTLVQIHRIPSSDHEEVETADTSTQQQGDTAQTEEPVDLVTF
ncbi:V-set and immunoglobulin domain-containing protein 10 isoform X2 [Xyrichtys novacula]|nr:V-set and immunoglobulin domain-containing protein 10 isoform X2 [Xyrichtys novacula]